MHKQDLKQLEILLAVLATTNKAWENIELQKAIKTIIDHIKEQ